MGSTNQSSIELWLEEIDAAFVFLRTSASEADTGNFDRCQALLTKAQATLESVRELEGELRGPEEWREVHARANELQAAIEALPRYGTVGVLEQPAAGPPAL